MSCAFSYCAVRKTLEAVYRRAEQCILGFISYNVSCTTFRPEHRLGFSSSCAFYFYLVSYLSETAKSLSFDYFYTAIDGRFIKSTACT